MLAQTNSAMNVEEIARELDEIESKYSPKNNETCPRISSDLFEGLTVLSKEFDSLGLTSISLKNTLPKILEQVVKCSRDLVQIHRNAVNQIKDKNIESRNKDVRKKRLHTMTWTVVEFIESHTVEAVPTSWLFNQQQCYWPPLPRDKLIHEIRNNTEPNTCWPLYEIRVFKDSTYEDYLTARKKARKAEDTSDLNTDEESCSRRKNIPKKIYSSESEDSEVLTINPPPKLIAEKKSGSQPDELTGISSVTNTNRFNHMRSRLLTEKANGGSSSSLDSLISGTVDLNMQNEQKQNVATKASSNYSMNSSLNSSSNCKQQVTKNSCKNCCPVHQKSIENFLMEILKKQSLLRAQLLQIQDDINTIAKNNKVVIDNDEGDENFLKKFKFPFNVADDLNLVEEYLNDSKLFKKAVKDLNRIGGNDVYDIVRRCLSNIITNTLASTFSFYGTKEKKIFKDLNICRLIIEVATSNETVDQKSAENAIKKWLRRAKERCPKEKIVQT